MGIAAASNGCRFHRLGIHKHAYISVALFFLCLSFSFIFGEKLEYFLKFHSCVEKRMKKENRRNRYAGSVGDSNGTVGIFNSANLRQYKMYQLEISFFARKNKLVESNGLEKPVGRNTLV